MQEFRSVPSVPTAVLAQRVLDVWITNDNAGLETELQHVIHRTRPAAPGRDLSEIESERQELIHAIAKSMDRERKALTGGAGEPRFGVWADLLRHLSTGDTVSSADELN
jgi:hypothetical protein